MSKMQKCKCQLIKWSLLLWVGVAVVMWVMKINSLGVLF